MKNTTIICDICGKVVDERKFKDGSHRAELTLTKHKYFFVNSEQSLDVCSDCVQKLTNAMNGKAKIEFKEMEEEQ